MTFTFLNSFRISVKKKRHVKKMEQWVSSKVTCEETKDKCLIEESELRKEIMRKEHVKKMEILEKEYEEGQKRENEEHKMRIENLKLQRLRNT